MPTRFPTDAILLAAGLGTRMRPLTDTIPKPLIRVAGLSLLERVAAAAHAEGVRGFVVNAHYFPDRIQAAIDALPALLPGARFALSDERDERLETGGGVKKAMRLTKADPIFVANTDSFYGPGDRPLARLAERHFAAPAALTLLCAHPARAVGFRRSHDFCLDPNGVITRDTGLPVIYAGCALIGRAAFDGTPQGAFSLNHLFEAALERGHLNGVLLDAPWYHVGDPPALAEVERHLREA